MVFFNYKFIKNFIILVLFWRDGLFLIIIFISFVRKYKENEGGMIVFEEFSFFICI